MSQATQQEETTQPWADRVLHVSEQCQESLDKTRLWARARGIEGKFDEALKYARTFSGGPECDWKTVLYTDIGFNPERPSFCFTVYRRLEPKADTHDMLKHYMTIGMIWFDNDNDWSFYS